MRCLVIVLVTWFGLLSCFATAIATADEQEAGSSGGGSRSSLSSDPEDPGTLLNGIQERRAQRDSLFPVSPLKWLHDGTGRASDGIYEATHIRLGLTFNHLFQRVSDVLPDTDDWGTDTDMDFVAAWDLINRGKPTLGQLYFHLEGRYDYGTTGPQTIGFSNDIIQIELRKVPHARKKTGTLPGRLLELQQDWPELTKEWQRIYQLLRLVQIQRPFPSPEVWIQTFL